MQVYSIILWILAFTVEHLILTMATPELLLVTKTKTIKKCFFLNWNKAEINIILLQKLKLNHLKLNINMKK